MRDNRALKQGTSTDIFEWDKFEGFGDTGFITLVLIGLYGVIGMDSHG